MGQYINVNKFILWLKTRRAEAYLNGLYDCDTDEEKMKINDEMYYSTRSFIDVLRHQPTVDAVEVVRCAKCKHWKYVGGGEMACMKDFDAFGICVPKFSFEYCSDGKRKEGGSDGAN